ncbi:MAG: Trk system potassium transporter TrkA [Gammaproteobacteria bacterium]
MKIIILGSDQVSETLAENLAKEANDITVIDTNDQRLREMQNRFDIKTIVGHGSFPDVLEEAEANDTDMLLAVSDNDEVNMLACQVAYSLFHIPIKIARIRTKNYLTHKELYCNESLPVDVIISPEQLVTDYVKRLIEKPGALQVLDFVDGKVQLVSVRSHFGGKVVGESIASLRELLKKYNANIAAIFRGDHSIPLSNDTIVEVGDEIFLIANSQNITSVMKLFRRTDQPNRNIMIAGGGNIGKQLAQAIEKDVSVKIIDSNYSVAQNISLELNNTTVLYGEASDKDLLINENIESVDIFCALTNDDEANIMSCLQAKRLGAKHTMALVTKKAYIDIIEGGRIDIVISPQNTTISSILTYIRRGDIVNVYTLRRGAAEALEVVAHGDQHTSKVVGKTISKLNLPDKIRIGAIVREGKMIVPDEDTIIQGQDRVILFVSRHKWVKEAEKLFQVKVTFI